MSLRILAVEDTATLRALLQLCLERAGHAVTLAEDGRAAVDLFRAEAFDAVVMDIRMPVMDGLTAVALMREHEAAQSRPPARILALTANTDTEDSRLCHQAGFDGTIRKPFSREELLGALASPAREKPASDEGEAPQVKIDSEMAELIPPFLAECRRELEAMEHSLVDADFKAIALMSHQLTGSGASYGFQYLTDASRRIETGVRGRDAVLIKAELDSIRRYLDRVKVISA